jgi:oligoribonuclease
VNILGNLIFGDCETTGLNENKDHVLELALVAVEIPTFRIVDCAEWLVQPPCWPTIKRNLHERVLKMHTKTGLIAALDENMGKQQRDVEAEACAFVNQHAPRTLDWHTPLAGAGPDFDRRFLAKHMPRLVGLFHYRNYDVRSVTQLQEWVFGIEQAESPHRALADCLKAVEDVKKFLGLA